MSSPPVRQRNAQRSRDLLLAAGEERFADHGFEGVSLQDVAADCGLSRGAPGYFFGSKRELYVAVLERSFAARDIATTAAFAGVRGWSATDGPGSLRRALEHAAQTYLEFLRERPTFARLAMWEALGAGEHLAVTQRESSAMHEAFAHVAEALGESARFDVRDAVVVFVGLTFTPFALRETMMRTLDRDLGDSFVLARQAELASDQLCALIGHA